VHIHASIRLPSDIREPVIYLKGAILRSNKFKAWSAARSISREASPNGGSMAAGAIPSLLNSAGIQINGTEPWDIRISDSRTVQRVLASGSLGLGESYMDGWWDCDSLDMFFHRVLVARLDKQFTAGVMLQSLRARLFNLQNASRAWRVARTHYALGNDFFEVMLDSRMMYTCGYWDGAANLEQAQTAKLDLTCRKLGLRPGMRLLDLGCGWGGLMKFAAQKYGVSCVGVTNSVEQIAFGEQRREGLPIETRLGDYRAFNENGEEKFDRVCVMGMMEHVGHKNYDALFDTCRRSVIDSGLFLLHTIGKKLHGEAFDRWTDRYIFPNGEIPALSDIIGCVESRFIIEDVDNFGADYDRTLLAWHARFEAAWPRFRDRYGERFYRMWRYYLLSCAGSFRARDNQLWQLVLSPSGVPGGYKRPELNRELGPE
jgi:cyclopropane-fatty-acyl-phospholipid synthase